MNDTFGLRDYLNYSISGFLWSIILLYLLLVSNFICWQQLNQYLLRYENFQLIIVILLLIGTYLIGNLFRFSEGILKVIRFILWGDPYSYALVTDKDNIKKENIKEKVKMVGIIYAIWPKGNKSIGKKYSGIIENNLRSLGILHTSKESQFRMAETYLILNFQTLKFHRIRDLKNLYESTSMSLAIILFILIYEIFQINTITLIVKVSFSAILILLFLMFLNRYRFLFANYIKDVYRYFMFIKNSSEKTSDNRG